MPARESGCSCKVERRLSRNPSLDVEKKSVSVGDGISHPDAFNQQRLVIWREVMSRRLKLLVVSALLLSLNGCIILPGHRHCCWRYDAAEYHGGR
jgi:hypothetical protein